MSEVNALGSDVAYVRAIYRLQALGPIRWRTTLEYASANAANLGPTEYAALANALVAPFQEVLLTDYVLDRIVCGSYLEDGAIYNPNSFVVREVNATGLRPGASAALPLSQTLKIRKQAAVGRSGNMQIRGCLQANDLVEAFGVTTISNSAKTEFDAILAQFRARAEAIGFNMVMTRGPGGSAGITARSKFVTNIEVSGIGSRRFRS